MHGKLADPLVFEGIVHLGSRVDTKVRVVQIKNASRTTADSLDGQWYSWRAHKQRVYNGIYFYQPYSSALWVLAWKGLPGIAVGTIIDDIVCIPFLCLITTQDIGHSTGLHMFPCNVYWLRCPVWDSYPLQRSCNAWFGFNFRNPIRRVLCGLLAVVAPASSKAFPYRG